MSTTARALRRIEEQRRVEGRRRKDDDDRRRRHLRVVRPDDARRRRSRVGPITVVLVVTLFVALFGLVVFHTVLLQHQSRIDDLDQHVGQEKERAEELRLEIAELESSERVLREARERLGMIPAEDVAVIEAVPAGP